MACRTPRGVRGLKLDGVAGVASLGRRRTPRGVRGLKYIDGNGEVKHNRRTPRGVRGLKSPAHLHRGRHPPGRTPRGVRGLKSGRGVASRTGRGSHPSRGAWIEILTTPEMIVSHAKSHPSRGAWIEISG